MDRIFRRKPEHGQKLGIFYAGQAGFVFQSPGGTTLGVDLYLSDCVERIDHKKRLCPKVLKAEDLQLDYVAATHWHLDHFDIDAMPFFMANRRTKLVAARDCEQLAQSLQLDSSRITYVKEGDCVSCGDFLLRAVFCDHGTSAPDAVGLVLEVDGYKVYIAGDTALRLDMAPEVAKFGPFDLMIAPINGAYGNLNEKEAVTLCGYHKPKCMLPCHYWMFAEHHGDPGVFMTEMAEKLPQQKYILMTPGESLIME